MKSQEMFVGFSPEQQAKHEQYLVDRYGAGMKQSIERSKAKVKDWKKSEWEKSGTVFNTICGDLVKAMERKAPATSSEVQGVIRRHYEWLKQFWTPTRESYTGHSQLIVDSELRNAYAKHHPGLPEFASAAMRVFAEAELA